jgi:hypothetical protein
MKEYFGACFVTLFRFLKQHFDRFQFTTCSTTLIRVFVRTYVTIFEGLGCKNIPTFIGVYREFQVQKCCQCMQQEHW